MTITAPSWDTDRLARTLRALSHPVRLEIVRAAGVGEVSVGDLAETLELPQPVTSQHLRVLREHEILSVRSDGNRRLYRLRPPPIEQLRALLDDVWPSALAALKDVAEAVDAEPGDGS